MSASSDFRPVTSAEPCTICGKPDWCRRTASGAHECHRIHEAAVNGFRRIARTPAGYTVYRHLEDPQPTSRRMPAPNDKLPRIFESPKAATEGFARWKKGTVERVYRWSVKTSG